jgi:hypothetical protein
MLQIHSEKTPNKLEANTLRCEDWHRRASEESYSTSRGGGVGGPLFGDTDAIPDSRKLYYHVSSIANRRREARNSISRVVMKSLKAQTLSSASFVKAKLELLT